MNVTVVWATASVVDVVPVAVAAGATVADAVARSGIVDARALALDRIGVAVFGRRVGWNTRVAEGDRIELTRPLVADPKEARRRRARVNPLPKTPPRAKRRRGE